MKPHKPKKPRDPTREQVLREAFEETLRILRHGTCTPVITKDDRFALLDEDGETFIMFWKGPAPRERA